MFSYPQTGDMPKCRKIQEIFLRPTRGQSQKTSVEVGQDSLKTLQRVIHTDK